MWLKNLQVITLSFFRTIGVIVTISRKLLFAYLYKLSAHQ